MVVVRRMQPEDAAAVSAVEERAFAEALDMATFGAGDLRRHMTRYPDGQLVAVDPLSGAILGAALGLRVRAGVALARHHWWEVVGGPSFSAHIPDGEVLYGADLFVDPRWQNRGVARALYDARARLLASTDCLALATGGRIPGYAPHAREGMTPQAYVRLVEEGQLRDPVLSFQLARGLVALDIMPRYLSDAQSAHHAVLLALPNPSRADAREEVLRRRALPWPAPEGAAGAGAPA